MTTYTRDDIKTALRSAGLPDYVRHQVYSNLPAKGVAAPPPPAPDPEPVTLKTGEAADNVHLIDAAGEEHRGCMIVAAASGRNVFKDHGDIVFWIPEALAYHDSYQEDDCAVVASYEDVTIDGRPLKGVI